MTSRRVPYRLLADLTRVGAAVGVAGALFEFPGQGAGGRFLVVLLALLVPKALGGVPAPLDLVFGVTLLATALAATSAVGVLVWWPLFAVATGLTAAVFWLVLASAGVVAQPTGPATPTDRRPSQGSSPRLRPHRGSVVAETVAIGIVVSVVWEVVRWLESVMGQATGSTATAASPVAHVLIGTVGALAAGWGLAEFVRRSDYLDVDVDRRRVDARAPLLR